MDRVAAPSSRPRLSVIGLRLLCLSFPTGFNRACLVLQGVSRPPHRAERGLFGRQGNMAALSGAAPLESVGRVMADGWERCVAVG